MARLSNKAARQRSLKLAEGLAKHVPPTLLLLSDCTPAEAVARLRAHVATFDAVTKARVALASALLRQRRADAEMRPLIRRLLSWIHGAFSNPRTLHDFGQKPSRKTGPKTVAVKLAAAQKLRATRKARHTMGKRQKAKIKG